jgi:hypothetical protein
MLRSKQVQVKLIKENPDGSAVFTFDMTPEETEMLLLNGIRSAIVAGIARGNAWKVDALPDLLDDDEPAVGLTE